MSNFKSLAKRKRELAKLEKRQAKDQKRALRRAERSDLNEGSPPATTASDAKPMQPTLTTHRIAPGTAPVRKPLTLAEAVERWKSTKITNARKR
jgi:hypothetical protein